MINKKIKKILVINIRYNGDVILTQPLIDNLRNYFPKAEIDFLVEDYAKDTTKMLRGISDVIVFHRKKKFGLSSNIEFLKKIYRKYNLAISLTASDRSCLYAILASNNSISNIEESFLKSWWKRLFLSNYYFWDRQTHIIQNNLKALRFLSKDKNISTIFKLEDPSNSEIALIKEKLKKIDIKEFLIFHPCSKYEYKSYPAHNRNELLELLSDIGIPVIVTGGNSSLDKAISKSIPKLKNIHNFIGKLSLREYYVLSFLSKAYVGVDTLNVHIAAGQKKKIFAIYGPTNINLWAPWSDSIKQIDFKDKSMHKYADIHLFQADLPCRGCNRAGCDNNEGKSICLDLIDPQEIYNSIKKILN